MGSERRVLVVGMNPGPTPTPNVKKYSALGRLYDWMSEIGVDYFSFVNAFPRPGNFSLADIDTEFLRVVCSMHDGPIIALGNVVSSALDRAGVAHSRVPHPSYRNRKLNSSDEVAAAVETIRKSLSEDRYR